VNLLPPAALALVVCAALTGCRRHEPFPARVRFAEVKESSGFRFRHELPGGRLDNLPKAAMGGLAVIDYDSDGLLDIYLVNGGWHDRLSGGIKPRSVAPNKLFRNLGNMRFELVPDAAGAADEGFGMGACVGDIDNDGHPDLFVSNYGQSRLYRNRGDGTFEDATERAGIRPGFHVGATFLDFDRDGLVDLFISQYVDPDGTVVAGLDDRYSLVLSPGAYRPQPPVLYRNLGDGRFQDVTVASGLATPGRGMGVLATDVDGDGWVDLMVANDGMENFVWRNRGDGTFTNKAPVLSLAYGLDGSERASMGISAADMDGDGRLDYLIPDTRGGSLYVGRESYFTDRASDWGLSGHARNLVGWADVPLDVDLDGRMDLYKSHGDLRTLGRQASRLFLNRGGGRFEALGVESPPCLEGAGRGAVAADFDNDGLPDLLVLRLDDMAKLFHNRSTSTGGWVRIKLVGTRSNRMALGARVTARAGERLLVAEVSSSTGYISAGDMRITFGLGREDELTDVVTRWPSGREQKHGPMKSRTEYVVEAE